MGFVASYMCSYMCSQECRKALRSRPGGPQKLNRINICMAKIQFLWTEVIKSGDMGTLAPLFLHATPSICVATYVHVASYSYICVCYYFIILDAIQCNSGTCVLRTSWGQS